MRTEFEASGSPEDDAPPRAGSAVVGGDEILLRVGVPRDLGRDQGRICAAAVRSAVAGRGMARRLADRLGIADPGPRRLLRDVRRHFPHQGEWLDGLARAAGVPDLALVRALRTALGSDPGGLALAVLGAEGPAVLRTAPPRPLLVHSRPEGLFDSVEVGSAVLTSPWAGVNASGLALAVVGGGRPAEGLTAPAALLARDCLERFEGVESALAWCLGRPAAADGAILLADASGEIAAVVFEASGRRVRRAEAGVLVVDRGATPRAVEVAKGLVARTGVVEQDRALARCLGDAEAGRAIRIDPARRTLRLRAGASPIPV